MDTTESASAVDNRLTEQLVVQENKQVRAHINRLRDAYALADGTRPSESEAVRRIIRAGLPVLEERLGLVDPGGTA